MRIFQPGDRTWERLIHRIRNQTRTTRPDRRSIRRREPDRHSPLPKQTNPRPSRSRTKAEELALAREVARQKGADFAMVLTTGDEEAIHEARLALWAAQDEVLRLEKEQ